MASRRTSSCATCTRPTTDRAISSATGSDSRRPALPGRRLARRAAHRARRAAVALPGATAEPHERGRRGRPHRLRPAREGRRFTVGRPFQTTLYNWRLNVSLLSAEELAASVERRRVLEMVLVGLSGLVVIAGMGVVVVAAGRERKLAALKSDFVANVSHELKTPLSLVRMFGELLQSGRVDSDEKKRQYLADHRERERAAQRPHRERARLRQGRARQERLRVRPRRSRRGRGARRRRLPLARRARAGRSRARDRPRLPAVRLDERAIEIAVINLLDNALKYAQGRRTASHSACDDAARRSRVSRERSRRRAFAGRSEAHLRALRARPRHASRCAAAASASRWSSTSPTRTAATPGWNRGRTTRKPLRVHAPGRNRYWIEAGLLVVSGLPPLRRKAGGVQRDRGAGVEVSEPLSLRSHFVYFTVILSPDWPFSEILIREHEIDEAALRRGRGRAAARAARCGRGRRVRNRAASAVTALGGVAATARVCRCRCRRRTARAVRARGRRRARDLRWVAAGVIASSSASSFERASANSRRSSSGIPRSESKRSVVTESTKTPFNFTLKCRCGPVERPVEPENPTICICVTDRPLSGPARSETDARTRSRCCPRVESRRDCPTVRRCP